MEPGNAQLLNPSGHMQTGHDCSEEYGTCECANVKKARWRFENVPQQYLEDCMGMSLTEDRWTISVSERGGCGKVENSLDLDLDMLDPDLDKVPYRDPGGLRIGIQRVCISGSKGFVYIGIQGVSNIGIQGDNISRSGGRRIEIQRLVYRDPEVWDLDLEAWDLDPEIGISGSRGLGSGSRGLGSGSRGLGSGSRGWGSGSRGLGSGSRGLGSDRMSGFQEF